MNAFIKSNLFFKIVSLIISIILWLYVVQVENPVFQISFSDVPVKLQNENMLTDNGLIITSQSQETIMVKVEGKRQTVSQLEKNSILATVDLKEITAPGNYKLTVNVVFPENDVSVVDRNPPKIRITVEAERETQRHVRFETSGVVKDGYYAVPISDSATVNIIAPESMASDVSKASATLDITGADSDVVAEVPVRLYDSNGNLMDSKYISADPSTVTVHCSVYPIKEIPVTWTESGTPSTPATVSASVKKIKIAGPKALLDKADSLNLGTIDLAALSPADNMRLYTIENNSALKGMYVVDNTKSVTLTVNFSPPPAAQQTPPENKEATVTVSKISLSGGTAGTNAELVTPSISVKVSGADADISGIKESDITAVASISELSEGEHDVPVTLSTTKNVTIEGSYSIKVKITATQKETNTGETYKSEEAH